MRLPLTIAVAVLGVAACAQPAPEPVPEAAPSSTATTTSMRGAFDTVKGYLTRAAEQVPEATYAFRATPEVRSFGALFAHVADSSRTLCLASLGETPADGAEAPPSAEETLTAKADIQQALADAFATCDRAFAAIDDVTGAAPASAYGMDLTRLSALGFTTAHSFEHYGNIVTYMRLNDMVPPSSQPATGAGM